MAARGRVGDAARVPTAAATGARPTLTRPRIRMPSPAWKSIMLAWKGDALPPNLAQGGVGERRVEPLRVKGPAYPLDELLVFGMIPIG